MKRGPGAIAMSQCRVGNLLPTRSLNDGHDLFAMSYTVFQSSEAEEAA